MTTLMTEVLNCSVGLKMRTVLKQKESNSYHCFIVSIMLPLLAGSPGLIAKRQRLFQRQSILSCNHIVLK